VCLTEIRSCRACLYTRHLWMARSFGECGQIIWCAVACYLGIFYIEDWVFKLLWYYKMVKLSTRWKYHCMGVIVMHMDFWQLDSWTLWLNLGWRCTTCHPLCTRAVYLYHSTFYTEPTCKKWQMQCHMLISSHMFYHPIRWCLRCI